MRTAVARSEDGPAPTLVLDGAPVADLAGDRAAIAARIEPVRREEIAERTDLGAKTSIVLPPDAGEVDLVFFQGLPDGTVDPAIEVCVNSAACALTVARHRWALLPAGPLAVRMGGQVFGFEEVAR